MRDYNCISGKQGVAEKRTLLNKSKWSSKTKDLINKQQQTINPNPQREIKWKTACFHPRASEQSSTDEDTFRYHTGSIRADSGPYRLITAHHRRLYVCVTLSECGPISVLCSSVMMCDVSFVLVFFLCVAVMTFTFSGQEKSKSDTVIHYITYWQEWRQLFKMFFQRAFRSQMPLMCTFNNLS